MSTYTTKQGDQWDTIAFQQLGSTDYTGALMAVNGRYLSFYIFPAGITLALPEIAERIDLSDDLPPWKQEEL